MFAPTGGAGRAGADGACSCFRPPHRDPAAEHPGARRFPRRRSSRSGAATTRAAPNRAVPRQTGRRQRARSDSGSRCRQKNRHPFTKHVLSEMKDRLRPRRQISHERCAPGAPAPKLAGGERVAQQPDHESRCRAATRLSPDRVDQQREQQEIRGRCDRPPSRPRTVKCRTTRPISTRTVAGTCRSSSRVDRIGLERAAQIGTGSTCPGQHHDMRQRRRMDRGSDEEGSASPAPRLTREFPRRCRWECRGGVHAAEARRDDHRSLGHLLPVRDALQLEGATRLDPRRHAVPRSR